MRAGVLIVGAVSFGATLAMAQAPLRAAAAGSPREGRPAPALQLPYWNEAGPGPADQPFRLGAELGRVVVLVFGGVPDSAARAGWSLVSGRAPELSGRASIVVGVVRGGPADVGPLAAAAGPDLKLLADADGRVHRDWARRAGADGWRVAVVADDGRVLLLRRLDPAVEADWAAVAEAVRRGRTAGGPPG